MSRRPFCSRRSMSFLIPALAVLLLNASWFGSAWAAVVTWDGGGDGLSWHNGLNWDGNAVPTAADDVTIGAGSTVRITASSSALSLACAGTLQLQSSLSLGSTSSIHTLQHTTGTLTVSGDLTITSSLSWSTGTVQGAGTTIIAPGATVTKSGSGAGIVSARTFRNEGLFLWTGGHINLNNGAVFDNPGDFRARAIAGISRTAGSTLSQFNNSGLFRRDSTTGTSGFGSGIAFTSTGSVEGTSGTLLFGGNSTFTSSGPYTFSSGAVLSFDGATHTFDSASSITAETVQIALGIGSTTVTVHGAYNVNTTQVGNSASGNLTVPHGTVMPTLNLRNGTVTVPGDLTITSGLNWVGGTLAGSGSTIIAPGATVTKSGSGAGIVSARTFRNEGLFLWTGGHINLNNGAVFDNPGDFRARADGPIIRTAGTTMSQFNNSGLFRKELSSGTSSFNSGVAFTNTGSVEGTSGVLDLTDNSTSIGGTYSFSSPAILRMNSGTHTFDSASSITASTVQISNPLLTAGNSTVTVNGSYDVNSTVIGVAGNAPGNLTVPQGTVMPSLSLINGSVTVPGDLTISSSLTWSNGTITGSGTTTIAPGATATKTTDSFYGGTAILSARTMRNEGTFIWLSGNINLNNGAVFDNPGDFRARSDAAIIRTAGTALGQFNNRGLLRREVGTGTCSMNAGIAFTNTGAVEGVSGVLDFTDTSTSTGGTYSFSSPAILRMNSGTHTFDSASSITAETVQISNPLLTAGNSSVTVNGSYDVNSTVIGVAGNAPGNLTVPQGTVMPSLSLINGSVTVPGDLTISSSLTWSNGTITGSGTTTIAPGATATKTTDSFYGGTSILSAHTMRNEGTFVWQSAGQIHLNNAAVFDNHGTFLAQVNGLMYRPVGATNSTFNNIGLFRKHVATGTTTVDGGICFVNTGVVDVDTGILRFSGCYPSFTGTYNVASTLQIDSVPVPDCSEADIVLETTGAQILNASGQSLAGDLDCIEPTGAITIQGGKNYVTDGALENSGAVTIEPSSALTVDGTFTQLAGTTLVEAGTLTALLIDIAGGLVKAQGLFDANTRNSGTLEIGVPIGKLLIDGWYEQTGAGTLLFDIGGRIPVVEYDQLEVNGQATFDGTLRVQLANGFMPAPGDSFQLILYGSQVGAFANLDLPALGSGLEWQVDYGANAFTLYITVADFILIASSGPGGTISPAGADTVVYGDSLTYSIAHDACYQIADVLVDGVSVGAVASYTFSDVQANHSIEASFALASYTVTASAGAGGTVSPGGASAVNCGADQSYTLTPDPGYHVADVLVDGVSVGAVATYTFTDVQAGHTIEASFAIDSYTLTATAGSGGTISPDGSLSVSHGADQTYTVTPDGCYQIADVLVDGASVGALAGYTFEDVQANHTIEVGFVLIQHTITATAGPGGSISPAGAAAVDCGADQSFTIVPDPGYVVSDVLVDGASAGALASYSFTGVTGPHTISASFALDHPAEVTVSGTVSSDCNGVLAGVTVDLLDAGGEFHTTVTGASGAYAFTGIPYSDVAGAAEVSIVIPLGHEALSPGVAGQALTLDQDQVVDFAVSCLAPTGSPRSMGYWKHNANVYLSGKGSAQESEPDMTTGFPEAIYNHFHQNALNGIAVSGVTYMGAPAGPIDLETISATLTVNKGGTMLDRAKQQYLAFLLNVASGKLLTHTVITQDGGTASQVLQYVADLILDGVASNDELAKDLCDVVNNARTIGAGLVPLNQYDTIAYARRQFAGEPLRVAPNPARHEASVIHFLMPLAGEATFEIFDASGRLVATPLSGSLAAGPQQVAWSGDAGTGPASQGLYFGRLTTPFGVQTVRFLRLGR